jgi:16S rRNA (cytosine967-C5)-methyltransferase
LPPTKILSPRFAAIETLRILKKERKPVTLIFDKLLTEYPLQTNDRQLANNIIYGVLRNQESLDRMLQYLCKQHFKKLNPFVHQALNIGLYQIIYLDRIPDSAAVNESVKAARTARLPKRLHGFINGVLRNSIRKRDELLALINTAKKPVLNHPDWLVTRWTKRFGTEKTLTICQQNNKLPSLTLQSNSCKIQRDILLQTFTDSGITAEKCAFSDTGIKLSEYHGSITTLPGFEEGLFQVQDQGAQLLCQLLLPIHKQGEYLDACAGAGGKSSTLLQLMESSNAKLTVIEPEKGRQKRFAQNMSRLHPEVTIPLFQGTLQEFSTQNSKQFNGILLDAPCSGTGVTGRHPDIRWNRREEDFAKYQETQLELLQKAATLLAPDGILVYATCSLENEENEQVIEQFLKKHPDFSVEDCSEQLPDGKNHFIRNGFFAPLPQPGMDGFFGARLRKNLTT